MSSAAAAMWPGSLSSQLRMIDLSQSYFSHETSSTCGPFLFSTKTSTCPLGLCQFQNLCCHILFSSAWGQPRMWIMLCSVSSIHSRIFDSTRANSRILHLLATNYTSFGFGKCNRGKPNGLKITNHNILTSWISYSIYIATVRSLV